MATRSFLKWALLLAAVVLGYEGLVHEFDSPTVEVQAGWTMVGALGVFITTLNLWDAILDKRALRESGRNGDLAVMAISSIRVEFLRLTKMLMILGVGLVSLSSTPTLSAAQRESLHIPVWTTVSVVLTTGLLYIVVVTMIQAVLDRRVRQRFYSQ